VPYVLIDFAGDNCCAVRLARLRSPALFCVIDLPKVIDAGIALRNRARSGSGARKNCGESQNTDATRDREENCPSSEPSSIFRRVGHIY
jgi:hypothetical protein